MLADARAVSVVHGSKDGDRHVERRPVVHVGEAPPGGFGVGESSGECQPADGLHDRTPGLEVPVGAAMSEATVGDVDDVGFDPAEFVVAETAVLHHARREILADDVADGDQLTQQLLTFVSTQVDRHAALADVVIVETDAQVHPPTLVDVGADAAQRVPEPLVHRVLDADDFGPECGQNLRGARTGELATQVAHPKVGQRGGHS